MSNTPDKPWIMRHKQRRNKVAEHAAHVVADEGIDAATIRRIAARAGFSTAVVTHYFATKEDVLEAAFEVAGRQIREKFEAIAREQTPSVVACLMASVPLDDERLRIWRIAAAVQELAKTHSYFAELQKMENERSIELLSEVMGAQLGDSLRDVREAAESCILVSRGLSMQIMADPLNWDEARATKRLEMLLKAIFDDQDALNRQSGRVASPASHH